MEIIALAEDPGLLSSISMEAHTSLTPAPGDWIPSSDLHGLPHVNVVHTLMKAHTHIHTNFKQIFISMITFKVVGHWE